MSLVYLVLALSYSLLTPAWEANDEMDHTTYIEYIVGHAALPRISITNGHESHQPPLYYILGALWQKILQIPVFTPSAPANPSVTPAQRASGHYLIFLHTYTAAQQDAASWLHEIRLLSVVLGLVTVLSAYGCARLILSRRSSAMAVALTVALLPKQLVVDAAVTNDALTIALCAVALYLFLLSERARSEGRTIPRRLFVAGLGLVAGLAIITEYTSLPLVGIFVLFTVLPCLRRPRLMLDAVWGGCCGAAVSAWWFIRNQALYGQFLANKASLAYLRAWLPALIVPVSWTNTQRFLVFVPQSLFRSVWFDGGWNQWGLPSPLDWFLWVMAAISVMLTGWSLWYRWRHHTLPRHMTRAAFAVIPLALLAGLAAIAIIAQITTQGEGRIAFVGLVAFAIILVAGFERANVRSKWRQSLVFLWPAILAGVNVVVFVQFLIPLHSVNG